MAIVEPCHGQACADGPMLCYSWTVSWLDVCWSSCVMLQLSRVVV